MANTRLYTDFIEGTLSADPGAAGTTLNAAILADVPAIAGGDTFKLVLDPDAAAGEPETVIITAHTGSATSATVTRGAEGTTGRAHAIGTVVIGPVTAADLTEFQAAYDAVDTDVLYRTFWVPGDLVVGALTGRWYHKREAITVIDVLISCDTAPTGAAILVDVNKNGTTIFSTQGNRPTIAVSAFLDGSAAVPDVTAFAATDYMEFEVDQIGSTIAGADMLIEVAYTVD